MIRGAAFWQTLGIPVHAHLLLPVRGADEEEAALWVYDVPFSIDPYLGPLVAGVGGLGVGVDVVAFYADRVAEGLHRACVAGALCFAVDERAPGGVCVVVLPAAAGIAAIGTQVGEGGKCFVIFTHTTADVVGLEALHDPVHLCELAGA